MASEPKKPVMAIEGLFREGMPEPKDLTERLTPAADLFVLAHLGIPKVPAETWSLRIDGLVDNPIELDHAALRARPKREVETVHQCAGSLMNPKVPTRRIANVRWGGADLADLLAEAGISDRATHLWSYGLDHGVFAKERQECYLKDLPLSRLADGDVLVAWELNGQPLSVRHGFPARLVVPGFFGTNSVKWLSRLHVADRRAESLFTTRFYNDPVEGSDATRPVWELAPESVIVSPDPDRTLAPGVIGIWGWAWSATAVRSVEVSTDGGVTWRAAHLEPRRHRSWQRFALDWRAAGPGVFELRCRATDADGRAQPDAGARNAVHSVTVSVENPG